MLHPLAPDEQALQNHTRGKEGNQSEGVLNVILGNPAVKEDIVTNARVEVPERGGREIGALVQDSSLNRKIQLDL
jgi:hypothetical protein